MRKFYLPTMLVTKVPKLSVKSLLYVEILISYHFGNKVPKLSVKSPWYVDILPPYHFGNKGPQIVCKITFVY